MNANAPTTPIANEEWDDALGPDQACDVPWKPSSQEELEALGRFLDVRLAKGAGTKTPDQIFDEVVARLKADGKL